MTTLNTRNFLKWTSIAINIENPTYNKSDCMKLAIKELQKEKKKGVLIVNTYKLSTPINLLVRL